MIIGGNLSDAAAACCLPALAVPLPLLCGRGEVRVPWDGACFAAELLECLSATAFEFGLSGRGRPARDDGRRDACPTWEVVPAASAWASTPEERRIPAVSRKTGKNERACNAVLNRITT